MTRQNRIRLLILGLLPAAVMVALSCADAPSAPDPVATTLARLHAQNDWVGEYHNEALQHVLKALQALPEGKRNARAVCERAIAAYAEFHHAKRHAHVPAEVFAAAERSCQASTGFTLASVKTALSAPTGVKHDELSPAAQSYFDQIVDAVNNAGSVPDVNASVNNIEADAAATLSETEAAAVVIVGSVTENSASYWDASLGDWIPYMATPLDPSPLNYHKIPRSASPLEGGSLALPTTPRFGFWSDFKSAARTAATADAKGAVATIVRAGLMGAPFEYEVILGGAAVASILAVLQM